MYVSSKLQQLKSNTTMKALQLCEDGEVRLLDVDKPTLEAGEVIIKVLRAGICQTDLEIIKVIQNSLIRNTGILGTSPVFSSNTPVIIIRSTKTFICTLIPR